MLKKIEAYIRHEKLDSVRMALIQIGVPAIDTVEVQGHGRQSGIKLAGRHATYIVDTLPRIQVNLVVGDEQVEEVVEAIRSNAVTGTQGDGAIFISPVENIIRISTGEEGNEALTYEGDIDIEEHQVGRD
ncbi:MAG: P-II family nitrogen regulator [Caldilineaceae bacterium]|nr:P-II family nitrogen regulator [Caldilineaceae bacterium]MCY4116185.1 P-II family nitrogen regulator [Caldilineaceae bacterium]MDE0070378.1 P-II family nitrogen regulator [Caldilineaceae bacterium]MDE0180822.1 P-II family nitrogen regulator [Caldilineaceae bacterium]MDE0429153.1 P-II family nitrogen regulator [Caldilineaceae bacterium]